MTDQEMLWAYWALLGAFAVYALGCFIVSRWPRKRISFAGIYGVTEDGCYLVMGEDGVIRKSHPVQPTSERS